jgi:hypothetical protein
MMVVRILGLPPPFPCLTRATFSAALGVAQLSHRPMLVPLPCSLDCSYTYDAAPFPSSFFPFPLHHPLCDSGMISSD